VRGRGGRHDRLYGLYAFWPRTEVRDIADYFTNSTVVELRLSLLVFRRASSHDRA
jgi:hypothetical protein